MHILTFVRGIVSGLINRYRPELHYMRGPGPKWLERHGRSPRGQATTSAEAGCSALRALVDPDFLLAVSSRESRSMPLRLKGD